MGGDFSLVRRVEEKYGNVNVRLMEAFNEMINSTKLRELHGTKSGFTWTNKQIPPLCVCWIECWSPIPGRINST